MDCTYNGESGCIDIYESTYIEFEEAGLPYETLGEAWAAYNECLRDSDYYPPILDE